MARRLTECFLDLSRAVKLDVYEFQPSVFDYCRIFRFA